MGVDAVAEPAAPAVQRASPAELGALSPALLQPLRAALRMEEGWGPPTSLRQKLLAAAVRSACEVPAATSGQAAPTEVAVHQAPTERAAEVRDPDVTHNIRGR